MRSREEAGLVKYSRVIALFSISFACAALNFWLVTTGHYRAPLFVFLGCVVITVLIFRILPPVLTHPQEIRSDQLRAAASLRRLGFLFILGFVFGLVSLFSGEFKGLPVWGRTLIFCWSGFLIWACFWTAKRYKKSAQ
jgi:hypothetical protein